MSESQVDKGSSTLQRASTIRSFQKNEQSSGSFNDRLKEIKLLLQTMLSEEKATEVFNQLDDLNEIYLADIAREKAGKYKTGEDNQQVQNLKFKKPEKILLQVREGNKIENDIRPQGEGRPLRSPEKKVEQKKFARFEPKRNSANTASNGLLLNRKTSPDK